MLCGKGSKSAREGPTVEVAVSPSKSEPGKAASPDGRPQLRQPRLADMVASILRDRIVNGDIADGAMLPKQDELLQEFRVSRPSLREALRILETEGLLTVRRGNVGGAVVQVPHAESAAYMFGLVLQSRNVTLQDLADAIRHIEPAAAVLCAQREDRDSTVVSGLRAILSESTEAVDDGVRFTELSRRFHEEFVSQCGNDTLILLVGSLERMWSAQEHQWAQRAQRAGAYPQHRAVRDVLAAHKRILSAIEQGNPDRVARIVREHLRESQRFALAEEGEQVVHATALRGSLVANGF
jgi:DNA-binding FadR family transcriptional regulator